MVVVTGAGAGIGRACTERYVSEGAVVVAADRDEASLDALQGEMGSSIRTATCDVTAPTHAATLVTAAHDAFGRLDVFHANAGGALPMPFEEVDASAYEHIRSLNLDAAWHAAQAAMPVFATAGRGVFLVTSSGAGSAAVRGLAAYGAAKAGVQALVRSLAIEYGPHGVRSCAISPGPIESPGLLAWLDTQPGGSASYAADKVMRRLGRPAEIAAAAAFLASDDASFVNGVTLPVDGGALAAL